MSGGRAFFDTNVLLYMYAGDPGKRARAIALYKEFVASERLVLSTQVVQEFYATSSRKFGIPRRTAREAANSLLEKPLVTIGRTEILSAVEIEDRYKISFWDALIIAAAESGGADTVFTEDLNDGQRYGTVTVQNPFRPLRSAH
jgi:predicted nucleic acid-binding protein